jgi:hypothetical protein
METICQNIPKRICQNVKQWISVILIEIINLQDKISSLAIIMNILKNHQVEEVFDSNP